MAKTGKLEQISVKSEKNQDLPRVLFQDCKPGQFIITRILDTIYEVVKARDVNQGPVDPKYPDATVMRCHWVNPKPDYNKLAQHEPGQITVDYFKYSFYGPFNHEYIEQFKKIFEKK